MSQLCELSAHALHELLISGKVGCREVVEAVLERIDLWEQEIKAYVTVRREEALGEAEAVDRGIREGGDIGPFGGIPVAVKDNICMQGAETTCGSHILSGFCPPYDATVVSRLKNAGAIIVGKANMDEFAMGSSTETSYFGITRNPWDRERVPGGSSGGSAAAVAAGEAIAALGSDTGGSIRQPAALCGVVGLKPTYGAVSRYGLVAFASSLDQIGPLARDVRDAACLWGIIRGHDPRDSTSVPGQETDYEADLAQGIEGIRIGIPREYFVEGMDGETEKAVRRAIELLAANGAIVEDTTLPHTDYAISTYYLIATSEAASNLARYDGVQYGLRVEEEGKGEVNPIIGMYEATRREGFGAEVKRRIMLGTYALSAGYYDAYYLKAQKVRRLIKEDFDHAWEKYDCLLTATSPTPAFRIGQKMTNPLEMYLSDIFTISANLAGIPAMSVPCGQSSRGLPFGLQLMAAPFREGILFRVARAYEELSQGETALPGPLPATEKK